MASPQLAEALAIDARNREAAGVTLDAFDAAAARASLPDLGLALPKGLRIEPAPTTGFSASWVLPANAEANRRIVYFHGGGFVAGSLESHRSLVAWLSQEAGARL